MLHLCRDFDEGLLKEMAGIDYDADIPTLPHPPTFSKYLVGEVATSKTLFLCTGFP